MRNGKVEHPSVTNARNAWNAEKQNLREDASRNTRFNSVVQDAETVGALLKQWMSETAGFIPTEFNKQSLVNAVDECLYVGDSISIKLLNTIFEYLVEHNHLERSGHMRVRGQGGVMVGPPTVYPVFQRNEEAGIVRKRGVVSTQTVPDGISVSEARRMPLPDLAAKTRAMRNVGTRPEPTETISEADARNLPLSELRKIVQKGYGKSGRQS